MYEVAVSATCWFLLLQFFLRVLRFDLIDSANLVYGVFGFLTPRFIEYYFYKNPSMLDISRLGTQLTWFEYVVVIVSAGYFLYDIPLSICTKEIWYMKLHHVLSFVIIASTLYYNRCGFDIFLCLWLGESTSPCAFWIFFLGNKPKLNASTPAQINKVFFLVSFLVLRFIFGPFLVYELMKSKETMILIKLGCVLFYIVNFILVKKMLVEIKNMYNNYMQTKKKQK
jgi:TLC domain.